MRVFSWSFPSGQYVKDDRGHSEAAFPSPRVHGEEARVCSCLYVGVLLPICCYFSKRFCSNYCFEYLESFRSNPAEEMGGKILFCVLTDVQINIKRCLSDGCDTRIHGLRAFGYQRVKKVGVSVCDASAIWYWSLLTSLVTASMETNPAFVHTILQNTQ